MAFSSKHPFTYAFNGSSGANGVKTNGVWDPSAIGADKNGNSLPNFARRKDQMVVSVNGVGIPNDGYTLTRGATETTRWYSIITITIQDIGDNDEVTFSLPRGV